jgi:hypothetical protein
MAVFGAHIFLTAATAATMTGGVFYDADDKAGLAAGETATASNFTNNQNGITGVKLYFDSLSSISITDFDFHFGNNNNTGDWDPVDLTSAALSWDNYELTLTWADPILTNGWLEIAYSTDPHLYFGNIVGDVNYDRTLTPSDVLPIINHLNSTSSDYVYEYDINGDGINSAGDALVIINLLNTGYSGFSIAGGPFADDSTSSSIYFPQEPQVIYELSGSGNDYALISTPVPEPATILLIGMGLIGMAGVRRKLKNQSKIK